VGAGLGLAISQSLVNMMGGTISVASTLGKGSVFSFTIRLEMDLAAQVETALVIPDLTGKHSLSVEDIEINRLVLAELLAETNAEVDEAVDGMDAVEKFKGSPEGYYCFVFMDLLMPNMNGHDAARCIRNLDRADAASVPIVALSANAYPEDINQSIAAGMNSHLTKPVDFAEIMRTLAEKIH
jgi:CheY-like chemotaxis protein